MQIVPPPIAGYVAEVLLLVGGAAFALRKLYLVWGKDSTAIAEHGARKDIVDQLRDELSRLSEQRLLVSGELNKLQLHILELTRQAGLLAEQVAELTTENVHLKAEIAGLRAEVTRLRAVP